ncbi:N-acetyltransferase [Paenibacillus terreus]|uniref:N-acetyltransferase n=1 Tax=Paenibacillus terreus TaxID=1387834 RepID=A0ABV5B3L5_9BACL
MITRLSTVQDYGRMVEIWLEGSKLSHDFIDEHYWASQLSDMKEKYLPMSTSYVLEEAGDIKGFISVVGNYLAALFIDPRQQGKGYGEKLLNYVKDQADSLDLKVYQQNDRAVGFYLKNGFAIIEEQIDENTSAKEYVMTWRRES